RITLTERKSMTTTIQKVVGLGEVLWDVFPDRRRPGGAPANVAFHASQLGCYGIVCSRVGADRGGDELVQFLDSQGIDTRYVQRDEEAPTGTVSVTVGATAGDHSFRIHEDVAWDRIAWGERLEQLAQSTAAVCFGTLAQRSHVSARTIHRFLAAMPESSLKVFDMNIRQNDLDFTVLERSLMKSTIVKMNSEEASLLNRWLPECPTSETGMAEWLMRSYDVKLVCVTRGAHGCLLVSRTGEVVESPMNELVEVVDTVGAGDAFTAGLIYAQLQGWVLPVTGIFANSVGALVVSRPGAMPSLRQEFDDLVAQYR
ncbi:MAG: carbohydrate kinase, partial [Planctomycetia bacterium]|nr:carbohydrate kinase [Planctomycetia bacterium]